jgi:hypothetical protein
MSTNRSLPGGPGLAALLAIPALVLLIATAGCSGGTSPAPASPSVGTSSAAATPGRPSASPSLAGAPTAGDRTGWPTGPTSVARSQTPPARLVSLRAARDVENGVGFDRLVLEFTGGVPGYSARYVSQVIEPGSGSPLPLAGPADFEIVLHPADAHDDTGSPTVSGIVDTSGLATVHQVALAGDFEGYVHIGVGLAGVTGYRVTQLTGPDRLVIDFAGLPAGAP